MVSGKRTMAPTCARSSSTSPSGPRTSTSTPEVSRRGWVSELCEEGSATCDIIHGSIWSIRTHIPGCDHSHWMHLVSRQYHIMGVFGQYR